ncbi:MAG: c-type cytochrome biogenesis protein CcsB [Chloroflexota bacterium]|nr:c-type cytochrome biogenesis protein CcsB [Chloroflexota bacterium]
MGFDPTPLGFNEPTLTTVTFVSYLLAFICYAVHLLAKSSGVAHVARGRMALAGAGAGGTSDVVFSGGASQGRSGVYAPVLGRLASGLTLLAWVSLTSALILRWVEGGHAPYVTLYEIATMLVWGMTTIYLVLFEGILRTRAAGAFVVLLVFSLQTYAILFIPSDLKKVIQLVPALRSYWLMIHVSFAIMAYSAFGTAAGAGLTLIAKHYTNGRIASALPSEPAIEEFMFRAVAVGFPLQTLLLITGAIWAQEAWTKAWSWDPKEVWALVTWLSYAAYLHVRVQRGVRGVTMAWLSLIGFVVVLITFLGVNYLVQWFGGQSMHTYSTDNGTPNTMGVAGLAVVLFFASLLGLALFSWLRIRFPTRRPRATK